MSCLFRHKLLIRRGIQQRVYLRRIRELHLDNPGLVRVFVDLVRRSLQLLIHRRYRARNRREQVAHRLHALHRAEGRMRRHRVAHARRIHIHNVTQRLLRIIGNADRADLSLYRNPLVLFGVPVVARIRHANSLLASKFCDNSVYGVREAGWKPRPGRKSPAMWNLRNSPAYGSPEMSCVSGALNAHGVGLCVIRSRWPSSPLWSSFVAAVRKRHLSARCKVVPCRSSEWTNSSVARSVQPARRANPLADHKTGRTETASSTLPPSLQAHLSGDHSAA